MKHAAKLKHVVKISRVKAAIPRVGQFAEEWPKAAVLQARAQPHFHEEDLRKGRYDLERVRHFYDRILAGKANEPIIIESGDGFVPFIFDGRHRLIAAIYAREKTIECEFGGWVNVLEYLEGTRRKCPI